MEEPVKGSDFDVAFATLTVIQNKLKVNKGRMNNFGKYKYRSCEDILDAVKPLLVEFNSSIFVSDSLHPISTVDNPIIVATATFVHKGVHISSESIAGVDIEKKGMDIAQTYGSSSSYARKYALGGLLLIDDSEADPDATNDGKVSKAKTTGYQTAKQDISTPITQLKNKLLTLRDSLAPEQQEALDAAVSRFIQNSKVKAFEMLPLDSAQELVSNCEEMTRGFNHK